MSLLRRFVVVVVLASVVAACEAKTKNRAPAEISLSPMGVLSGADTAGYARADGTRKFQFPEDHGPHPAYRSEWWYFTGPLVAQGDRRFGYQLTIFRQAVAPAAPARASAWATRQVYLGHLAIAEIDGKRFHAYERTAREGDHLAGAKAHPLRVWVEDWLVEERAAGQLHLSANARPDGRAAREPAAIDFDLDLGAGRGPILQGDAGLSRKGPEPGNASYYYSFTRIPTHGTLTIGAAHFDVAGETWLDREWSTSALGSDLAGWDWLALSLSDGRDLMVFRLRGRDGSSAAESRATVIMSDRSTRLFPPQRYRLRETGRWNSSSGAAYPNGFTFELPDEKLRLTVVPALADQELRLGFRYWEGLVNAEGTNDGTAITGRGYLELTGYARPTSERN